MDNTTSFNASVYDGNIRKVIPYYDEIYNQVFDVVRTYFEDKSISILDTGCGSGIFGVKAYEALKVSNLTMCDPSENMLSEARAKLNEKNAVFRNISSQQLDYVEEFDLVVAIQSHHYVNRELRAVAVRNCYNALKSGGMFICFENTAPFTEFGKTIILKRIEKYGLAAGRSPKEVVNHSTRYNNEYFPITPTEHLELLKNTGFSVVEMLWYSYMQSGYYSIK